MTAATMSRHFRFDAVRGAAPLALVKMCTHFSLIHPRGSRATMGKTVREYHVTV